MNFFKRFFGRKKAGGTDPVHNDGSATTVEPTQRVAPTQTVAQTHEVKSASKDAHSLKADPAKGKASSSKQVANDSGKNAGVADKGKIVRFEIDDATCRKGRCMFCTTRCPKNAIGFVKGKVVIDASKCDLCGICCEKCPCGAVTVIKG